MADAITGLATGLSDLDKMTSGLQPSDLVIVAGRPSMGKTTLVMNMAEHAAIKSEQASIGVFDGNAIRFSGHADDVLLRPN